MDFTVNQGLSGVSAAKDRASVRSVVNPIADRLSSQMQSNSTLVIGSVSKKVPKTGAAISYGTVQGIPREIAGGTAMPALSGTVTADAFNVYCFFIDTAGTVTSAMGTEGATYAAVKFPPFPVGKTLIGWVRVNPTGTGDFVGGTTDLDDATVVPNAVYVSPVGPFDPTILL